MLTVVQLPVLAHNSGGPLETIQEGATGWHRPDAPQEWTDVIRKALFEMLPSEIKTMGTKGREGVIREFSKEKMAERLENEFDLAPSHKGVGVGGVLLFVGAIAVVGLGFGLMAMKQF
jgi:alpha-1,3/alpha-1,6-mannosyltransferase